MNICMTHYAFYPTTGGVETHMLDLCAELARRGNEVHALVGSMPGQPKDGELDGIRVHRTDWMDPEHLRERKQANGLDPDQLWPSLQNEIEANYRWPDPDWWDYSRISGEMHGKEHLPVQANGLSPFMRFGYLRGLEQSFIDLVENPDIAHYVLDKLVDLETTTLERTLNETDGEVMYAYIADDFGSQEALMISLDQVREFYIPKVQRAIDLLHEAGAVVFHHNDGAIRPMIPDMIDAGIDVLNPVQWRCQGMEREALKRDFGDRLVFHAAMDNQYTLAFGTVDEVRQEVFDNLRILGEGGGYILAPCHNIQAVSPPENVVAMYETAYEEGWS